MPILDKLIKDKVDQISFSQIELDNIAAKLSNLKSIINNQPDYREPFLGGSYKRATMVKGVSDVDVYFRYIGIGNSQTALGALKKCLIDSYPRTVITQDHPSILAEFNSIPINITPYKEDFTGTLSIPDKSSLLWKQINFGQLEESIKVLRQKNSDFIDLIKILKLWNKNYAIAIKNFEIEKKVCDIFLSNFILSANISDWLYTFFKKNGFQTEANRFSTLMMNNFNEIMLKSEWLKFISNN